MLADADIKIAWYSFGLIIRFIWKIGCINGIFKQKEKFVNVNTTKHLRSFAIAFLHTIKKKYILRLNSFIHFLIVFLDYPFVAYVDGSWSSLNVMKISFHGGCGWRCFDCSNAIGWKTGCVETFSKFSWNELMLISSLFVFCFDKDGNAYDWNRSSRFAVPSQLFNCRKQTEKERKENLICLTPLVFFLLRNIHK